MVLLEALGSAIPVVAAAVILPKDFTHEVLRDSKKLSERQRDGLYEEITGNGAISWSVAKADLEVIVSLNILGATHLAMRRAIIGLHETPAMALIDGRPVPDFPVAHRAVVKGDDRSFSIAAASIIAKVERDRIMLECHRIYPEYGFVTHKGYGTARHLKALRRHGPCPIHRKTFGPIARLALELEEADCRGN